MNEPRDLFYWLSQGVKSASAAARNFSVEKDDVLQEVNIWLFSKQEQFSNKWHDENYMNKCIKNQASKVASKLAAESFYDRDHYLYPKSWVQSNLPSLIAGALASELVHNDESLAKNADFVIAFEALDEIDQERLCMEPQTPAERSAWHRSIDKLTRRMNGIGYNRGGHNGPGSRKAVRNIEAQIQSRSYVHD